jgi:hypothetical protein
VDDNPFKLPDTQPPEPRPSIQEHVRMALILIGFSVWALLVCSALANKLAEAFGK